MICPNCNSAEFTKGSSFVTQTEPLAESASGVVAVDMMHCKRCSVDVPAIRGKQKYVLLTKVRLSNLLEKRTEMQAKNSDMKAQIGLMEARREEMRVEIEKSKIREEIDSLRAAIAGLDSTTSELRSRRSRLEMTIQAIARVPMDT